jgi:hypothetical protein
MGVKIHTPSHYHPIKCDIKSGITPLADEVWHGLDVAMCDFLRALRLKLLHGLLCHYLILTEGLIKGTVPQG